MRLLCDLSDDRLVDLFRAGREDAFGALYDRYRLRLVRFARRILSGAADEAEDVVQEAFLRAHAALRATDRAIVLAPWLYTIVRNRALDVRRSRGLSRERHRCQPVSLLPLGDPELSMDQRERLRRVVDQIGHLPEREAGLSSCARSRAGPMPSSPPGSTRPCRRQRRSCFALART